MIKHPAKFSAELLPIFQRELEGYEKILDPFAGTGKIRLVRPDVYLLEIEPEWAEINNATVGNAENLPWDDNFFDAIITSPTYGNRMADHHDAKDDSRRNTYKHALGRDLTAGNTGHMQWGSAYRLSHFHAWKEVRRVLKPGGKFILNISDHIRKGKVIHVSQFHRLLLQFMGFELKKEYKVKTPRQRYGANSKIRVEHEYIYILELKPCTKVANHDS